MPAPIILGSKVIPRIKFTWGRRPLEQAHWRGGLFTFYSWKRGFPRSGLAINVVGLVGWALGLGATAYLGIALAFTHWFRGQPHNRIGFADVLAWPVRRSHMAQLRGRAWLAQGEEAMAAKRWAEGVFYLRRGLEVCPDDLQARLDLVQFYLLTGQRVRAMDLLVAAPRYAVPSRAWLEAAFQLMTAGEDWGPMLQLCDACLTRTDANFPAALRQRILAHKAEALLGLGRPAEALAAADAGGDADATELKTQQARALLALGRVDEALAFLARWHEAARPADRAGIQQLHVRALRESGRLDLMEQELDAICAANPTLASVAAFAVEQRARAGRGAAAAVGDYVFRFGGNRKNLRLLIRLLADIPDVGLCRRVAEEAAARGYPMAPYNAAVATALLRAGDFEGLARAVQAIGPGNAMAEHARSLWYLWIKGLAEDLIAPPGAHLATVDFLAKNLVSLEAHQLTVDAFRRAGRLDAARDLLVITRQLYPESQNVRAEQASVARELAAQAAATAVPAVPQPTAPVNADDFFRRLDAAMAAQDWPAARDLISAVRTSRQPPAWLGSADTDLLRRELRINQALGESAALQLAANLLLNAGPTRADEVLAFARDLDARGAKADATMLANAVRAKYPDNDTARELLAGWSARDAK